MANMGTWVKTAADQVLSNFPQTPWAGGVYKVVMTFPEGMSSVFLRELVLCS